MATLRQLLANRENAKKSTGPKTAEGKDASRRNALKHGLTAELLVLPDEEEGALALRISEWVVSLSPRDARETWLVEQAAAESLRVEACQRREIALRTQLAARALSCWEEDRRNVAEAIGAGLAKSPSRVSRMLASSKQGCDWLIARWEGLQRALDAKGEWDAAQRRLALDLLGTPPELRDAPNPLLEGVEARRATVAAQIAHLAARKAEALDAIDLLERDAAELGFGPDPDRALALVRRYERACTRRLEWALAQLKQGRQARRASPLAQPPAASPTRTLPPRPMPTPDHTLAVANVPRSSNAAPRPSPSLSEALAPPAVENRFARRARESMARRA